MLSALTVAQLVTNGHALRLAPLAELVVGTITGEVRFFGYPAVGSNYRANLRVLEPWAKLTVANSITISADNSLMSPLSRIESTNGAITFQGDFRLDPYAEVQARSTVEFAASVELKSYASVSAEDGPISIGGDVELNNDATLQAEQAVTVAGGASVEEKATIESATSYLSFGRLHVRPLGVLIAGGAPGIHVIRELFLYPHFVTQCPGSTAPVAAGTGNASAGGVCTADPPGCSGGVEDGMYGTSGCADSRPYPTSASSTCGPDGGTSWDFVGFDVCMSYGPHSPPADCYISRTACSGASAWFNYTGSNPSWLEAYAAASCFVSSTGTDLFQAGATLPSCSYPAAWIVGDPHAHGAHGDQVLRVHMRACPVRAAALSIYIPGSTSLALAFVAVRLQGGA